MGRTLIWWMWVLFALRNVFIFIAGFKACHVPKKANINITYATCTIDNVWKTISINSEQLVPSQCVIVVKCHDWYRFPSPNNENTFETVCANGIWSPEIPQCQKICQKLFPLNMDMICHKDNTEINCWNDLLPGTKISCNCERYYYPDFASTREIVCNENGEWSHPLISCMPECGKSHTNQDDTTASLISDTKQEQFGDSPWQIAIYEKEKKHILVCGGTIISSRIVVSAAHCFITYGYKETKKRDESSFIVVVSKFSRSYSHKDNSAQKDYKIREIRFPDGFQGPSTNFALDIALLILETKITFGETVLPACVDWTPSKFNPRKGSHGKIVGWGTTDGEVETETLTRTTLQFFNYSSCLKITAEENRASITLDKFCGIGVNGSNAQKGDSGSGFLFSDPRSSLFYVRGVVSIHVLTGGIPIALFTDIGQYISWILEGKTEVENEERREYVHNLENHYLMTKVTGRSQSLQCENKASTSTVIVPEIVVPKFCFKTDIFLKSAT